MWWLAHESYKSSPDSLNENGMRQIAGRYVVDSCGESVAAEICSSRVQRPRIFHVCCKGKSCAFADR